MYPDTLPTPLEGGIYAAITVIFIVCTIAIPNRRFLKRLRAQKIAR